MVVLYMEGLEVRALRRRRRLGVGVGGGAALGGGGPIRAAASVLASLLPARLAGPGRGAHRGDRQPGSGAVHLH